MRTRKLVGVFAALCALSLGLAACGGDDDTTTSTTAAGETGAAETTEAAAGGDTASGELTKVKLQLQWFTQAQFAGYYAAVEKGFFKEEGLDVEIVEGGVDIVPQQQLADGQVDFALSWVPKALASREAGADIVNVAQIFQRSGTLQVSFKDKNITKGADFKGKKIGNWGFGNEYEVFAAMSKAGLDPAKDVTLVQQQFDMVALLAGEIDAAEAMTYNEYAQVLEAKNPKTGALYKPEDFNVVDYNKEGVGMLQDAIWADGKKLASDKAYQDTTTKFIAGSIKGWAYCRDNAQDCADIVVGKGSQAGQEPPAVADERDQQARLAVARWRWHLGHQGVGPDGQDQPGDQEPGGQDRADQGARRQGPGHDLPEGCARRPEEGRDRRRRCRLQADHRHPHRRRQVVRPRQPGAGAAWRRPPLRVRRALDRRVVRSTEQNRRHELRPGSSGG